jgi:ABC-type sugar transport system ATPase subunit
MSENNQQINTKTKKEIKKEIKEEHRNIKIREKALMSQRTRTYNDMVAYEKKHNKERKVAPRDEFISLQHINKIYDNKVQAVYDFNLKVKKHEFIVFVGPSGCGKSTTLRMIAGLENITAGDLFIDGVYANDLEPKDRNIAMVFQSYALYPHMSVAGNMSFGLKIRKVPTQQFDKNGNPLMAINKGLINDYKKELKNVIAFSKTVDSNDKEQIAKINKDIADYEQIIKYLDNNPVEVYKNKHLPADEIRQRVLKAAKILQIEELLDRKPKALSGGQCQRVALGRAIVRNAKVFLMDEPLSNLDAKLRVQMRSEIIKLHEQLNATTIYVTHDQTEAMTMATRIVVMSKGHIQQIGSPSEIYNNPANIFVATFIGSPSMNLFDVKMEKDTIFFANGEKIDLGKDFGLAKELFYKNELASYLKEKEDLLLNFKEKNDIEAKLILLNEKTNKTLKETEEIKHLNINLKHTIDSNERLKFLEKAVTSYQEQLKAKKFDIIFGIRPEDIYQENHADNEAVLSKPFDLLVSVAELLGHEYFIHMEFDGKDLVAKISAKRFMENGAPIKVVLDLSKSHIFDKISGKLIK